MKLLRIVCLLTCMPWYAWSQRHEIGLTMGGFFPVSPRTGSGSLDLGTGTAFQANYAYRAITRRSFALLGEVHFLANPLREVSSSFSSATRDVATIYATPGVRLKFRPASQWSPYILGGGGYALYEQSYRTQTGDPNGAPRFRHRGTWTYGGGMDFPLWRWIGGRVEIRDFYSGLPAYNVRTSGAGQHNVVLSGGFVVRLGDWEK